MKTHSDKCHVGSSYVVAVAHDPKKRLTLALHTLDIETLVVSYQKFQSTRRTNPRCFILVRGQMSVQFFL